MKPRSMLPLRRPGLLFGLHLASLAVLLYHYHRYVPGLVSPVFLAGAAGIAVGAAVVLERVRLRAIIAVAVAGIAVWLAREAGVAVLGRIQAAAASSGTAGLTARFDSGIVAAMPAMAVAFLLTFALRRRPRLYLWHPALVAPVVAALFWSQGHFDVTIFPHPSILAATITGFLLLEAVLMTAGALRLGARRPRGGADVAAARAAESAAAAGSAGTAAAGSGTAAGSGLRRREAIPLVLLLLPLLLIVLGAVVGRYNEGSTGPGGGLIRPTLFRFDFADYVNLESEISLSRDLVLLYREQAEAARQELRLRSGGRLLRRFVLSGYDPRQGFFAETPPGEVPEPRTVGEGAMRLPTRDYRNRSAVLQEYYLVNFDPSSLVSVNYPVEVVPYEAWSDSSFARIYEVTSRASDAPPGALARARVPRPRSGAAFSEEWYRYHTDYGGNEALADLAREVTAGVEGDWAQARAIEQYFLDEFYYSLRPGVAADGNQLHHFLFESRKGYCSYFAFSMTLMARSLGLPARVAVGFFVDPRMSVMDYYAVRADMAHAWVEVYFEDYGWIEFDPTASTIAPGEEFALDPNLDMEQISALLEELINNRDELSRAAPAPEQGDGGRGGLRSGLSTLYRVALRNWWVLLAVAYVAAIALYRYAPRLRAAGARDYRGRVRARFAGLLRALESTGFRASPHETVAEYAARLHRDYGIDARPCTDRYLAALFGAAFEEGDYEAYLDAERTARTRFAAAVPRGRRLLGFLAPYLHLRAPQLPPDGERPAPGPGDGSADGEARPAARDGRPGAGRSLIALVAGLLALGLAGQPLPAQQTRPGASDRSAGWYADRALEAIESEHYERAVEMLEDGQERYPEAVELYTILGDLYFGEELYRLALEEYRAAEDVAPRDFGVLRSTALSLGRLNEERESVRYLERLLELYPDSPDVIADLGWMYFKTHQLERGEELLLEAIEEYGNERNLTMTLGTIYADMYRFEDSKEYYERSIESALEDGRSYFASVAYYNLSLLQKAFYRFNGAMQSTDRSIHQAERSTGHLAKGELYEMQMDFRRAHDQYTEAYNLDEDTPLAKLDLAALYQTFGRLDEALAYVRDVYESDDLHWMFNFGTDERRHRMELHDLLATIYRGKARVLSYTPSAGPLEWIANTAGRIRYRVLSWYHDMTFRRYATDVARAYETEGSTLNAYWTYYRAHERYPRLAAGYLDRARRLETRVIPEADPFYAMNAAVLRSDRAGVAAAVDTMHPRWERSTIAVGLREIALLAEREGDGEAAARAAVELYRVNRGGLRQHRIELPVALRVSGPRGRFGRRLLSALEGAGLQVVGDGSGDAAAGPGAAGAVPLRLEVEFFDDGRVAYRLLDEGRFLLGDTVETAAVDRTAAVRTARRIADDIFRVE